MRRTATLLLLSTTALLTGALPAAATVEQIVDGMRKDRLYVGASSAISPDREAVLAALDEAAVVTYVAVAALGGGGWLYARGQRRLLASAPLSAPEPAASDAG